jgi:hypothetical protein
MSAPRRRSSPRRPTSARGSSVRAVLTAQAYGRCPGAS